MLDWLIVGAGVQGITLAVALAASKASRPERIVLLDPTPSPLANFYARAHACGMTHLRSPAAHTIAGSPTALIEFARSAENLPPAARTIGGRSSRPSLELFKAHVNWNLETHLKGVRHVCDRALTVDATGHGYRVHCLHGALETKRIVLALGAGDCLSTPDWATDPAIPSHHVLDPTFRRGPLTTDGGTVVVGGGITAVQTAMSFAEERFGNVTLLVRHPMRIHDLDVDRCWLAPNAVRDFECSSSPVLRRRILDAARNRGSIPRSLALRLEKTVQSGRLTKRWGHITSAASTTSGVRLQLHGGETLAAGRVVLATGFSSQRPGGPLVDGLVQNLSLPVAGDGYPLTTRSLEWRHGLFVMGPLAELTVGPLARNILGGRLAVRRILKAA